MPRFEVLYSFTCQKCTEENENRIEVVGADKTAVYGLVRAGSECAKYKAPVDPNQEFTSTIQTGRPLFAWSKNNLPSLIRSRESITASETLTP